MESRPEPQQKVTLSFIVDKNKILLAQKKRGFGKGKWNGYGGKPEKDDADLEHTAVRETEEEIGVRATKIDHQGCINFFFENKPEWNQQVHIYRITKWFGEPAESEEMLPKWFDKKDIPYEDMWIDDKYWLPKFLEGELIKANFVFGGEGEGSWIKEMHFFQPEEYNPPINPLDKRHD